MAPIDPNLSLGGYRGLAETRRAPRRFTGGRIGPKYESQIVPVIPKQTLRLTVWLSVGVAPVPPFATRPSLIQGSGGQEHGTAHGVVARPSPFNVRQQDWFRCDLKPGRDCRLQ